MILSGLILSVSWSLFLLHYDFNKCNIILKYETIQLLYFVIPITDQQNLLMGVTMKILTYKPKNSSICLLDYI